MVIPMAEDQLVKRVMFSRKISKKGGEGIGVCT